MVDYKILTIVGTRPELIRLCDWEKEIIFTGQHFSYEMGQRFLSDKFKDQLKAIYYLPYDINHSDVDTLVREIKLKLKNPFYEGAGGINKELNPDCILVHGDTRSALAGARVAKDLNILLAHTEAGVRCFEDTVEEKIRKEIDHLSNYNFCPVPIAVEYLKREGITEGVYFTGDILYDRFLKHQKEDSWDFVFVTIHRFENIENKERLKLLIDNLAQYKTVIFPIHPHTQECLDKFGIKLPSNVLVKSPLDYDETLKFIKDCKLVLTDSGGIEREAFWLGKPCKVLRENTEWKSCTEMFGKGNAGEIIKNILDEKKPYRKVP